MIAFLLGFDIALLLAVIGLAILNFQLARNVALVKDFILSAIPILLASRELCKLTAKGILTQNASYNGSEDNDLELDQYGNEEFKFNFDDDKDPSGNKFN